MTMRLRRHQRRGPLADSRPPADRPVIPSRRVRCACWGLLGSAVLATGLVGAVLGTSAGRWLIVAGVGLTLAAVATGLGYLGRRALAVAAALFLGVGTAGLAFVTDPTPPGPQGSVAAVSPCSPAEFRCLQRQYADLVTQRGTGAAFTELRRAYASDEQIRLHCHQLTHAIGRAAGQNAPSLEAAFSEGEELCGTGYWHGVMETAVAGTSLSELGAAAERFCASARDREPRSVSHQGCSHGLGHGFMNAYGGDVFAALRACDALRDSWERGHCWNGVFMENVPDGDNPHPSRYLRADEPLYPCTAVEQRYRGQCYQKQTSYALQLVDGDFAAVFALCSAVTDPARPDCFQGIGRNAVEENVRRATDPATICALGADVEARSDCTYGVARYLALYHHDRTVAESFCTAQPSELASACRRGADTYPRPP